MKFRIVISAMLAGVILVVFGAPVLAHHSIASFWNDKSNISITGVVKKVSIMNPHSEILIDVTEGGQTSTWLAVGGSALNMTKAGASKETLKVGDRLSIDGHPPRKEGAKGILIRTLTTSDGKTIEIVRGGQPIP